MIPSKRELKRVMKFVHQLVPYRSEEVDFYATLRESIEAGGGDCDSIVGAEWEVLRTMGVADKDLIWSAGKLSRGSKEYHMVLVCGTWVLCNVYGVVPMVKYYQKRMRPIYTMSPAGLFIGGLKLQERSEVEKFTRFLNASSISVQSK